MSIYENEPSIDYEVVVFDNASDDNSVLMIRENFPKVRIIESDINIGFGPANNRVMESSDSDYFLLLNSDTIVVDDVMQKCVVYLEDNQNVGLMGCSVLNSDGTPQQSFGRFPTIATLLMQAAGVEKFIKPETNVQEKDVEVISGCYLMVRSAAMQEVGMFDERFFFYAEETDWCRRFRQSGWHVRYVAVGTIIHHGGGSVKKLSYRRELLLGKGILRLHQKHFGGLYAFVSLIVLYMFSFSRAVFWLFVSTVTRRSSHKSLRDKHFMVLLHQHEMWPSGE